MTAKLDGLFTVRMTRAEIERLDQLADGMRSQRGRMVRLAIREFMERNAKQADAQKLRNTLSFFL